MRSGLGIAAAFAALVVAAPRVARADAHSDLEKAYNAYASHQLVEAEARLRALLDSRATPPLDADDTADARMYLAATLVAEGRNDEAATVFGLLLEDRPDYQPDPLRVPLDAIDAFTDTKARLHDRLAAAQAERVRLAQEAKARSESARQREAVRVAMLEKLASTEIVTEHHSRWLGLVPFGVGQLQNGDTTLGWIFLVSEGLLAAGSGVGAGLSIYNVSQRNDAITQGQYVVAQDYDQRAQASAIAGDVLAGAYAVVAVAGIVQAQLAFVPATTTERRRELPKVGVTPIVAPGGVGLAGRF